MKTEVQETNLTNLTNILKGGFEKEPEIYQKSISQACVVLYVHISALGALAITRGAHGVVFTRKATTEKWQGPFTVKYGGLGIGFEAGFHSTEAVYTFPTIEVFEEYVRIGAIARLWSARGSFTCGNFSYAKEKYFRVDSKHANCGKVRALYYHSRGINLGCSLLVSGFQVDMRRCDHVEDVCLDEFLVESNKS